MIHKKYLILFAILISHVLLSDEIHAQNNLNLTTVDQLSFEYFNAQDWNKLIDLGKKANRENIEFYYLNYRMGIAYYSKKNYRKAISFFEKVINSIPNDAIAKEYLYYSYLLGGRTNDAIKVLSSLSSDHLKKVEFYNTNNLFNGLGLEYKYSSFQDYAINKDVNEEIEQKTRNYMNYFSIDLMNYTQKNSTFYFNFSTINGGNSLYNYKYSPEVIDEKLNQYQLYFSWDKNITKGLSVNMSLTYMRENLKWYDYQYSNGNGNSSSLIYDGGTNNFVGTISFTKSNRNLDFTIGSSISSINNEKQAQPFTNLVWHPFGNTSFFSSTNASYQYNFSNNKNNVILKQSFTAKIGGKLNVKAFGLYGKVYNYVDDNGLSIYNNLDAIEYWYGFNAKYYLNKTTEIYMSYRLDRQTNTYLDNNTEKEIGYNVNSILLGLRFKF